MQEKNMIKIYYANESKNAIEMCRSYFDFDYYLTAASELGIKLTLNSEEAFIHFMDTGWKHGLSPSPKFDTKFYLNTYADVSSAVMNPLFHYISHGITERRAPRNASSSEIEIAKRIVDSNFYTYRYHDLKANVEPVEHFATFGYREMRDPNPFSLIRFISKYYEGSIESFEDLAGLINSKIFHNPLLRREISLDEIYALLDSGKNTLEGIFIFDAEMYSQKQQDVLKGWKKHPIDHLFTDGLFQNRLRNGGYIDQFIIPFKQYDNDYELFSSQTKPLPAANFSKLKLTRSKIEESISLAEIKLSIGVVLYKNSRMEIERLAKSIQANAKHLPCPVKLSLYDNSPNEIDLEWVPETCPDIVISSEHHPENTGFAFGHNELMKASFCSGASYYLGLNPDGHLLPDSILNLLKFAVCKDHPVLIEMDSEPLSHPKWYHPVTGETDWVSGSAFLLDGETYNKTGGFDPNFPMYCEDVDLSLRAKMAGVNLYVSPRGRFYHDTSERMHVHEEWRSVRMLVGTWYLCEKWDNREKANLVLDELLRRDFDIETLPQAPKIIENIPLTISNLMQEERFAVSRFWCN